MYFRTWTGSVCKELQGRRKMNTRSHCGDQRFSYFNIELEDGRHCRRHQDHVRSCLSDISHVFPSFNSNTGISVPSPVATRHDSAQLTAVDCNSSLQLLFAHTETSFTSPPNNSSDQAGQRYPRRNH